MELIPIVPRKPIGGDVNKLKADIQASVRDTIVEGHRLLSKYPEPQMLNKTGYVRTGTLRRSWSKEVKVTSNSVEGTVYSSGPKYNVYVQGPKDMDVTIPGRSGGKGQLPMFEDAGWFSVSVIARTMQNYLNERLDKIFGKGGT